MKCERCMNASKCHHKFAMEKAQEKVDEANSILQFDGVDYDILHAATICYQYTPMSVDKFETMLDEMMADLKKEVAE